MDTDVGLGRAVTETGRPDTRRGVNWGGWVLLLFGAATAATAVLGFIGLFTSGDVTSYMDRFLFTLLAAGTIVATLGIYFLLKRKPPVNLNRDDAPPLAPDDNGRSR
ncbi:hypothetical protein [Microbacterium kunmingense]|uniref:hypothetical protein n=1 Tax=Microbacterium kunmingense TaxID=2915939 RepID=UPI003D74B8AB